MSMQQLTSPRNLLGIWIVFACVLAGVLATAGKLQPISVPDTPSYVHFSFESWHAVLLNIRTPGYPAMLQVLHAAGGTSWVPCFHFGLHLVACVMLAIGLKSIQIPRWHIFLMSTAVLFSNTLWFNVNVVATDSPAASLSLITLSLLLMYCQKPSLGLMIGISAMSMLTILCRPAYLFLIGFLPAAAALTGRSLGMDWIPIGRRCATLVAGSVLPILGYCLLRWIVIGHFGVVAFGSQNLAGVTIQFMDQGNVDRLPAEMQDFAQHVLDTRVRWYSQHPDLSEGMGYQTMEDRWNAMIYDVVVPVVNRDFPDDLLTQHAEISRLNRELILQRPFEYARWIGLASRQTVRVTLAHIGLHPPFCLCLICISAVLIVLPIGGGRNNLAAGPSHGTTIHIERSIVLLPSLALLYCTLGMIPVILTSAPLGRFVDAVAIFIPGAIAVLLSHHLASITGRATYAEDRLE